MYISVPTQHVSNKEEYVHDNESVSQSELSINVKGNNDFTIKCFS